MVQQWNGQFCLKGIMSVADAKRAAEIQASVAEELNRRERGLTNPESLSDGSVKALAALIRPRVSELVRRRVYRRAIEGISEKIAASARLD